MIKDRAALVAGSIRLASGISFLIDPLRANRLWESRTIPGLPRACCFVRWGTATP